MKTKSTHRKPARTSREKVSALRRQSASTEQRTNLPAYDADVESLVRDLGKMIETARHQAAVAANASLTTLFGRWASACVPKFLTDIALSTGHKSSPLWGANYRPTMAAASARNRYVI